MYHIDLFSMGNSPSNYKPSLFKKLKQTNGHYHSNNLTHKSINDNSTQQIVNNNPAQEIINNNSPFEVINDNSTQEVIHVNSTDQAINVTSTQQAINEYSSTTHEVVNHGKIGTLYLYPSF